MSKAKAKKGRKVPAPRSSRLQFGPDPVPRKAGPEKTGGARQQRGVTAPPGARPRPRDEGQGRGLIVASWIGTAVLAATAVLGLAATSFVLVPFAVSLGLFVAGIGALVAAYARAVGRSRQDEISVFGLFFLAGGSAPRGVQAKLLGALLAQVAVGFAAAGLGVNTLVATALLAPVYGLGLMGLWGARYGVFPPRIVRTRRPARR